MKRFEQKVHNVLKTFQSLQESPVSTDSSDMFSTGVYGHAIEDREAREQRMDVNYNLSKKSSRYYFSEIANSVGIHIEDAMIKVKSNDPSKVLAAAGITEQSVTLKLAPIISGIKSPDDIVAETFLDVVADDICDRVFKVLFAPNTQNLPVTDTITSRTNIHKFYNPVETQEEFELQVQKALWDPDTEQGILVNIAQDYNINIRWNQNKLKLTAQVITQSPNALNRDFDASHPQEKPKKSKLKYHPYV
jgi:hypothetical protein